MLTANKDTKWKKKSNDLFPPVADRQKKALEHRPTSLTWREEDRTHMK